MDTASNQRGGKNQAGIYAERAGGDVFEGADIHHAMCLRRVRLLACCLCKGNFNGKFYSNPGKF